MLLVSLRSVSPSPSFEYIDLQRLHYPAPVSLFRALPLGCWSPFTGWCRQWTVLGGLCPQCFLPQDFPIAGAGLQKFSYTHRTNLYLRDSVGSPWSCDTTSIHTIAQMLLHLDLCSASFAGFPESTLLIHHLPHESLSWGLFLGHLT